MYQVKKDYFITGSFETGIIIKIFETALRVEKIEKKTKI